MMRSLRGRLFVGLAAFIVITGIVAGAVMFHWAYEEALEAQDALLLQVGALVVGNRLQTDRTLDHGVEAENRVVVEELDPKHVAKLSGDSLLHSAFNDDDGLQTISQGDVQWRVLVRSRSDGSRVAVGQLTAYRDEIARGTALRAVLSFAVLVPGLMLLVGVVISYSLRPVSQLADKLDASDHDHLAVLPLEGMPKELRPFVESINRLLRRIAVMLDQQRRFVADAAHELRSPITALSVQAVNLDHADMPQESRRRLAVLQTGIRRTAHLLEQLLALAKYDSPVAPQGEAAAFDRVARDVVADLLPTAQGRTIDLGFERIESATVRVDALALAVLARNLIDNALRYTPDGGQVDVYLYGEGGNAVFRVEDTGPGICDEDLPRIFEPFYRGQHNKKEGTGLGLSIVQRVVRGGAGSVVVENIKASTRTGLRVVVTIPLARQPWCSADRVAT